MLLALFPEFNELERSRHRAALELEVRVGVLYRSVTDL